jgi:hypothetical protein
MRKLIALAVAAMVAAGCSSQRSSTPSPTPQASIQAAGSCGSTPVLQGGIPAWLDDAGAHNNPGLPYVIASPPQAAGFLFAQPLKVGHPENPTNKILWVVRKLRKGQSLEITGHPVNATVPSIDVVEAPNSGPGEIYPSVVDVPQAGCWHLDLAWAGNHASVELLYK